MPQAATAAPAARVMPQAPRLLMSRQYVGRLFLLHTHLYSITLYDLDREHRLFVGPSLTGREKKKYLRRRQ
jgi:hypothetical protein